MINLDIFFDHCGENGDTRRKSTQIKCTRIFSWAFLLFLCLSLPLLGSHLLLLIQKCIFNVLLSFQIMWNWKIYPLTGDWHIWGMRDCQNSSFLVFYSVLCKTFLYHKKGVLLKAATNVEHSKFKHLLQSFILLQQLTLRFEIKRTNHNVNSRLSLPCVLPYSSSNGDPVCVCFV